MYEKVALLDQGVMGVRMFSNLLASEYDITIWNKTVFKADKLIHKGATWTSPVLTELI